MCGIVGYIGNDNAKDVVLNGLMRLEYRGYDSAGIAMIVKDKLEVYKKACKVRALELELNKICLYSNVAIGHTRWATHGEPNGINAHPHLDCTGKIAIVHNGIIENYEELKKDLLAKGHRFKSETDSEVIAHLIEEELKGSRNFLSAFKRAIGMLKGSYAVAAITLHEPDAIFVARKDSPLVVGIGKGEKFLASDVPAFLQYTKDAVFMDNGEIGVLKRDSVEFFDISGRKVEKEVTHIPWSIAQAEKAGFKHFMLKEIYEQPRAISDTISGNLSSEIDFTDLDRINIVACGTSYHAGLIGKFYIENFAGIPVNVDYASEFRYRNPPIGRNDLCIFVSQSGETADTLAALSLAKQKGARTLAVCNVLGSTITRQADLSLYTYAGPEISVASTKAFTTQIALFFLLSVNLGFKKGVLSLDEKQRLLSLISDVPSRLESFLELEKKTETVKKLALEFYKSNDALYVGRHVNFPIALEGALKLKEISYIHADGYPAGEMKHGPIALVTERMPVVFIATKGKVYEKIVSNIEEVKARKGKIVTLTNESCQSARQLSDFSVIVPEVNEFLSPLINVVPLQLFAYHIADFLGYDVDQPRNLAKSVTVE